MSIGTGLGVVERGLLGPHARADVHLPLDLSAQPRPWLQLRARPRWTVWRHGAQEPARVPVEAAAAILFDRVLVEAGWREEFGHGVASLVIGLHAR